MDERSALKKTRDWYEELKRDRRTWEPYWRDVRDYIAPQRGRFLSGNSASEVNNGDRDDPKKRINGAASRALNILASGMQSGVTSKARPWFVLSNPDPELNRYKPVQEWYAEVQEVLLRLFARSNTYASLLHTYFEMGGFGQGAMAVLEHPDRAIYCRPFTTGTYYLSSNSRFEIDAFFYVEYKTARQLEQEYGGEKLPEQVKNALNSRRLEERFETVNAILADPDRIGAKLNGDNTVASVHFLAGAGDYDGFLRVSGYRSFPVLTPRWDAIDADTYGWAPTRDIMGNVRMLQTMESDCLKAIAKGATPPMRVPPELERRGLNLQPGALNVVSSMSDQAVAPLYTVNMNVQQLQLKIDAVVKDIQEGLYNSLFLALLSTDNPQMTAREVAERHEEKLLMLGPVLERIHGELLDPLIDRAFLLAFEAGLIPPPPAELAEQPTQIEYTSILTQAQKAVGVNRIEQSFGFLASLVPLFPEMRYAVKPFQAYRAYNAAIGVDPTIMPSEEEFDQRVASDQQKQEIAQAAEVGNSMAQSASLLADADLTNVQQMLGGGGLAL